MCIRDSTGRAGNTGLSTAFFNRGNRGIVRELIELLKEANQEIPSFLETIAREGAGFGGGRGSRMGGGRARGSGASRDVRSSRGGGFGGNSYGGGHGGYSGGGGGWGGPPAAYGGGGAGGYGGGFSSGGGGYGNPSGPSASSWW